MELNKLKDLSTWKVEWKDGEQTKELIVSTKAKAGREQDALLRWARFLGITAEEAESMKPVLTLLRGKETKG